MTIKIIPTSTTRHTMVTVGYDPRLRSIMFDGKAGGWPWSFPGVVLNRMFLLGEPTGERTYDNRTFDFGIASHDLRAVIDRSLAGFTVRVNIHSTHFSTEVVKACCAQATLWMTVSKLMMQLAQQPFPGDAVASTMMLLDRLNTAEGPQVGYPLSPPILMTPDDDLRIEGIPPGMQLWLTGVAERAIR